MKIKPIYKNKIVSLPGEALSEKLSTATKEELLVIISVILNGEFDPAELASRLDITEKAFNKALSTWIDCGAIEIEEKTTANNKTNSASSKEKNNCSTISNRMGIKKESNNIEIHSVLPHYTSGEIASIVERNEGCAELIDSCQQILGKIFNASEVSIIVGLLFDHLSLSTDYILLLCSHAALMQKKSVRYIEKLALDLTDRDIITYQALEEELSRIEQEASLEKFVRNTFGLGKRTLIKKEKDYIRSWNEKFDDPRELIKLAYEITITKTNEPSLNYANAILENWYAAGIKTPEDVDAAERERSKIKEVARISTFETDDFFEAALKRSYQSSEKK